MMFKVAIDGPSGAGKSTISKEIAKRLGFIYVDTGAMYRAAALKCIRENIQIKENPEKATLVVSQIVIDIDYGSDGTQLVYLDSEDVTNLIRTPDVSIGASDVSAIKEVRLKLVDLQRKLGEKHNVIMDGRDIGTYVLPDADVKIFLTATAEDRAKRRYDELILKGQTVAYDEVLQDMIYRDKNDSSRAFAPLKPADDSILIDTTGNELETSIDILYTIITERLGL